jgi:hypothetical protein
MTRAIKVLHAIFAIAAITLGIIIGGLYGWETHGLIGAVVVGAIGGLVGAVVVSLPSLVLQVLR